MRISDGSSDVCSSDLVGSPVYVYSAATFRRHARVFRDALLPLGRVHLAYAIKANPNVGVLRLLADEGYGADVVSGGEMARALAAGMPASEIEIGRASCRERVCQYV